jgi:outer membrane protein assembly factor BamB
MALTWRFVAMREMSILVLLGAVIMDVGPAVAAKEITPAAYWPCWRGPSGQGYVTDTHVPLSWSETQNLLWKTALPGEGNSTPVIWGERVFVTGAGNGGRERYVVCLRTTDGKILWQQLAAQDTHPGKTHDWNGYASPSCTTDGSRVYAFFGTPGLFCYDVEGQLLWHHRFGIFTSRPERAWGTAASPFLYGDVVIQNCDNDGADALPAGHRAEEAAPAVLVALDKVTGKVRWTTPRDQGRGFSTPVIIPTPQGQPELVLNSPRGVWAYDPQTGKELWHCNRPGEGQGQETSGHFGEPMPAFNHEIIFGASGRSGPFQAIRMGGVGDVTQTHVLWEVVRKGHRDVASPILWNDLLYVVDYKGILTCIDPKTGRTLYEERLGGQILASPVAVRGKLLFLLDSGVTVVVEPGRRFQVAGRNRLGSGGDRDFRASPAVADNRLFLRSPSTLYCVGEK